MSCFFSFQSSQVSLGSVFRCLTALYGDYHLKMSKEKDTDQVEVEESFVDRFV